MESVIILIISTVVLYYLSRKQDKIAETLFANTFNRFERRYNDTTYSCPDAIVVRKQIQGSPTFLLIPSINYTARALCLSEEQEWFWFDSSIRHMKIKNSGITPASAQEANEALRDSPEVQEQYFPKKKQSKTTNEAETTS